MVVARSSPATSLEPLRDAGGGTAFDPRTRFRFSRQPSADGPVLRFDRAAGDRASGAWARGSPRPVPATPAAEVGPTGSPLGHDRLEPDAPALHGGRRPAKG
jgi:hypothetical protein